MGALQDSLRYKTKVRACILRCRERRASDSLTKAKTARGAGVDGSNKNGISTQVLSSRLYIVSTIQAPRSLVEMKKLSRVRAPTVTPSNIGFWLDFDYTGGYAGNAGLDVDELTAFMSNLGLDLCASEAMLVSHPLVSLAIHSALSAVCSPLSLPLPLLRARIHRYYRRNHVAV